MRRIGSLSFLVLCTLLLACVMGREGDAASDGASLNPPIPGRWVLLTDRPVLRNSPGGSATGSRLDVEALKRVHVVDSAAGGEKALLWLKVETDTQSGWLPDAWLAPPPLEIEPMRLDVIGKEPVDRFHGLPPDYVPSDLIPIAFGYESDRTYRMRREPALALERMIRSARREGLDIQVVSAFRSYETQRRIYLGKLKRSGWKQQTVAKPGHSEHQLGTTADFAAPDESTLLKQSFGETPEGRWLRRHAPDFGFAVSYTEHNRNRTGYAPEPWHFRYYGTELAPAFHARALGPESD